mmetsp:Transcript_12240/g.25930  ORF Transcript_12240/g.25930 Transcript_12240/m.25930 type:complete len:171 (-) Transcript_12240:1492-2004(-)|eukprot:CAMPEP_0201263854 /NCGR_PEP_ID=MMETSP0853-20130426/7574_1 /ASSEMBLY_ACC=CAM_ASM_000640 /TAXON_ID=183588 /ORGANISM="Pseudo-nitzschia fraudulenta, Strain WWA7" /LENGTH=170 /DNA_ID=CAMNT_0047567579 /DNA_START=130 /DNA_END=642 /DNA_ORIENTATION=-
MLSRSSAVAKTILSRTRGVAARSFSSEATEAANSVTLNFSVPYDSIYNGASVEQVIIPGTEGEYGVTANHVPYVSQMKPGILTVMFDATESEKYFVAGGYATTHANSVTDVVCVEAVKLDDLDTSTISANYEAAKSAAAAATAGSVEEAEAQIDMEVNKTMGSALGLTLG